MSKLLHLSTLDDLERLEPMVAAFHEQAGIQSDEHHRKAALEPLLKGEPYGAIWLIGPRMSPVGYLAVSFGWSIELGGLDAMIDEFWIREPVRGRGMGSEALAALKKALTAAGVKALSLEVADGNQPATSLYLKAGFQPRPYRLMTWRP